MACGVCLSLSILQLRAEEIDRMLAAVNGRVITEGDLRLARELNTVLSPGGSAAPHSPDEELSRLVDLELMRQELENFPMAPEDQGKIEERIEELGRTYAPEGGLAAFLRGHGIQESEFRDYVRLQDSILRFIDFRFRPFVSVADQEIERYYKEKLVPPLEAAGASVPPLAEVSGKIEEILREEQVSAALSRWLQDIRRHSRIEYFLDGADASQVKTR